MTSSVQTFRKSLSLLDNFDDRDVIFDPSTSEYVEETKVWDAHRDLKPELLLRPKFIEQTGPITKLLYESFLDFAVRNGGVGSTSARDVLVSLSALNSVSFDPDLETVTVGAGALWRDVDSYMGQNHPGWAVVSARTPFVGVVGSTLVGGMSWLSHEFGLMSDPQNLLDVRVALRDGRLVWASKEENLLWAVRGGRCSFGIIVELKFRARRLELDHIYSAQISYPLAKLDEVSRAVSKHVASNRDPYLAFHAFILNPKSPFFPSEPGVGLWIVDRHGSTHARSSGGFKDMLEIEGGQEQGKEVTFYEVNQQTDFTSSLMGTLCSFEVTALVAEVDDMFMVRAKEWFYKVLEADPGLAAGSYCILEICQPPVFGSTRSNETAWPHGNPKHVLQLGVGFAPEHMGLKGLALELLAEAFKTIPLTPLGSGDFAPTFIEPSVMDVKQMYGENYTKLESIADQYDPKRKFRTIFKPSPNFL